MKTLLSIFLLTLWGVILAAGVAVYVLHGESPTRLAQRMQSAITQRLDGVSCTLDTAEPVYWPVPGLHVKGLVLRDIRDNTLLVDACVVKLSWKTLLKGDFIPGSVVLTNPLLRLKSPADSASSNSTSFSLQNAMTDLGLRSFKTVHTPAELKDVSKSDTSGPDTPKSDTPGPDSPRPDAPWRLPDWLSGMSISIQNGQFQWQDGQNQVTALGITAMCTLPVPLSDSLTLVDGEAVLDIAALEQKHADRTLFSLREVRLTVADLQVPATTPPSGRILISTQADVDGAVRQCRTRLKLNLDAADNVVSAEGELLLDGEVLLNGHPTPLNLHLPFTSSDITASIRFSGSSLTLEKDNATFDAELHLRPSLLLSGTASTKHLSLTRWFGFARDLPPSLQFALDDLQGWLRFELTPQGLVVPELEAVLLGAHFTGNGGVDSFASPVLRIQAGTPEFDVNNLFPELKTQARKEPLFPGPPAVPTTPPAPDDLGYDIRLSAAKATALEYAGNGLDVSITPLPKGSALGVSLAAIYGGKCKATLNIEDDFALKFQCNGISGEDLSRPRAGAMTLGGKMNAEGDVRAAGNTAQQLLTRFSGTLKATVDNGFLAWTKAGRAEQRPFTRLETTFAGKGAGFAPDAADQAVYDGRWQLALNTPAQNVSADLSGPVRFSTRTLQPVLARNLPANASGTFAGSKGEVNGRFSFDPGNASLELSEARGRWGNLNFSGNIVASHLNASPAYEGTLEASTADLRSVLERAGTQIRLTAKNALRNGRMNAHFVFSDKNIQLTNLTGFFDDTTFKGELSRSVSGTPSAPQPVAAPPVWRTDLKLGTLNADLYMGDGPKSPAPWPADALTALDLQGRVRVGTLIFAKIPLQDVDIPLNIRKGVLEAIPLNAQIQGGQGTGSLRVETASGGFLTNLNVAVKNANMLKICTARQMDSLIGGRGSFNTDVKGLLRAPADIPATLNGSWGLRIENGYLGSKGSSSRRTFKILSASGRMQNGVLFSDDLYGSGDSFNARGGGRVNLVDWTINYKLTVSTFGISDIPVSYSGSLNDPQRNINALSVFTGALESIGRGVFRILDNVVTTPLKMLNR